ncbi:MAG: DUF6924 domain-containing protein [Pirellulaceae bacterium]|jgi:hypothetical protein
MPIPDDQAPWVVRTDFSNNATWDLLKRLIAAPQTEPFSSLEFSANVRFVEERTYENLTSQKMVELLPEDYPGYLLFLVDDQTIHRPMQPILVVDFSPSWNESPAGENDIQKRNACDPLTFRAIPSTIQSIENNLSLGNMDFHDFAAAVSDDGIFRGFPG